MRSTPIPTELADSWQHALERWADPGRHDTALGLAAKHHEFAWLATKYREATRSNPSDVIAPNRLERVVKAATIVAFTLPRQPVPAPQRRPYRGAVVLLIGAVIATGIALRITEDRIAEKRPVHVSGHP
jgi:hypothetical protein